MTQKYDVVIVGTGFASSFFLMSYLERAKSDARVLVLERGRVNPHAWQMQNRRTSDIDSEDTFVNQNPKKKWAYNLSFGGGSNCWWAATPRMMPNDFKLKSTYGVGVDWAVSYDDLDEHYERAENVMSVSGSQERTPFPLRRPYPQSPHKFSDPDKLLKKAYPDLFFAQPTARARVPTANRRAACCASGVCTLCPVDAKFTIQNEMAHLYKDARVTLITDANVQRVETAAGIATGVNYLRNGASENASGDLIVLGANGIFNPHILLRSSIQHPLLGKRLGEQRSINVDVLLDGLDNFQGSTSITGHGYMLYDGAHRKDHAACLIETVNAPTIRLESRKQRQILKLRFIFEDLPDARNYLKVNERDALKPETVFVGHSAYTQRGIDNLPKVLPKLLAPLPIEKLTIDPEPESTEAHILGTTVMGDDPAESVIDRHLVHHKIRNLVVLGSGAFPTAAPANPTLTLSALSLWSAKHLFG